MLHKSNLPVLIALAIGAGGGWAASSGQFDSLLKADQTVTSTTATPPTAGLDCCGGVDKAALTAIRAHNEKVSATAAQAGKKPNIVVIMGDDVGIWNIGAYHRGMMAGKTPHLDKL